MMLNVWVSTNSSTISFHSSDADTDASPGGFNDGSSALRKLTNFVNQRMNF